MIKVIIYILMMLYGATGLIKNFLISPTYLDKLAYHGFNAYMIGYTAAVVTQIIVLSLGACLLISKFKSSKNTSG